MVAFEYYFFWSSASLVAFYLFYLLLLRRETFFVFNRIYLLSALCLSMVIPFLNLSWLITLPKVELVTSIFTGIGVAKLGSSSENHTNWLIFAYWVGVAFNVILLLIKVVGIKEQMNLPKDGAAFSFWKTKVIDKKLSGLIVIDAHENIHVKQLHTLDILLIELMGIFFWFNPVIYAYRRSLKFIHEYLADEYASNFTASKKQYAMLLFSQNLNAGPILANTFYSASLLESRIKMLQREKSERYKQWKYLLCLPLFILITLLCSFKVSDFNDINGNKVDRAASFPGGFESFREYLIKSARKVSGKNGRVKVSFIVETNGTITHEKIELSLDGASDQEALRVMKSSPNWKPASQNGHKVRSSYQIGINFISDNQLDK